MQNKKIVAAMIIGLSASLIGHAAMTMDRWETLRGLKEGMRIPERSGSWAAAPSPASELPLRQRSLTHPSSLAAASVAARSDASRLLAQKMSATKSVVGSPVLGLARLVVQESSWENPQGFFASLDGIFDDDSSAFFSAQDKCTITRLWNTLLSVEINISNPQGGDTVTRQEEISTAWVYCYGNGLLRELKRGVEMATVKLSDTRDSKSLSVSYKSYSITTADYAPLLERNRRFVAFLDAKIAFLEHLFKTEDAAEEALERLVGDDEVGAAETEGAMGDLEWYD